MNRKSPRLTLTCCYCGDPIGDFQVKNAVWFCDHLPNSAWCGCCRFPEDSNYRRSQWYEGLRGVPLSCDAGAAMRSWRTAEDFAKEWAEVEKLDEPKPLRPLDLGMFNCRGDYVRQGDQWADTLKAALRPNGSRVTTRDEALAEMEGKGGEEPAEVLERVRADLEECGAAPLRVWTEDARVLLRMADIGLASTFNKGTVGAQLNRQALADLWLSLGVENQTQAVTEIARLKGVESMFAPTTCKGGQ